jgi:dihydroorotate dehydrogenase
MSLAAIGFALARPLLHGLDAEQAHRLTIRTLSCLPAAAPAAPLPQLSQKLFGLDFPNPLGLAAGFDKNGEVPGQMLGLGFGFVEVGTVTPRQQAGNPKPRLFRLVEDHAVINRMGFNNEGHGAVFRRLRARKQNGVVGVNIGANKDSPDRMADYVAGLAVFAELASYFTINISSPNTPGLRGLQSADELPKLLDRLNGARASFAKPVPMFLKIAPDLGDDELLDIAKCCAGGAVDAVIISNTTLSRPALRSSHHSETGGLSGRPLRSLSTQMLARFFLASEGKIPLIGAGGIEDADSAIEKILAGASLLQVYSALVYRGPALISDVLDGLPKLLAARGITSLAEARGADAVRLATRQDPADKT